MPLLQAGEPRAVRALGQVIAQAPTLLSTEPAVDGPRHRELRLGARELVLELLCERSSRAEQERLERGGRHAENLRDLVVRAALELAQDDRLPLLRRNLGQRSEELADTRCIVVLVRSRMRDSIVELDLARPRLLLPEALLDRVARDREQPVGGLAGPHALLERSVRVQEGRLRDVLGVGVVSEHGERVPVHLRHVRSIEVVYLARREVAGFGDGHG